MLLCPRNPPGKNTEVGCHFLLQRIFPTQGSEPKSPALQADSSPSKPPGKHQQQWGKGTQKQMVKTKDGDGLGEESKPKRN